MDRLEYLKRYYEMGIMSFDQYHKISQEAMKDYYMTTGTISQEEMRNYYMSGSNGYHFSFENDNYYIPNNEKIVNYSFPLIVRCKYCDGKNKEEFLNCIHCGAPL